MNSDPDTFGITTECPCCGEELQIPDLEVDSSDLIGELKSRVISLNNRLNTLKNENELLISTITQLNIKIRKLQWKKSTRVSDENVTNAGLQKVSEAIVKTIASGEHSKKLKNINKLNHRRNSQTKGFGSKIKQNKNHKNSLPGFVKNELSSNGQLKKTIQTKNKHENQTVQNVKNDQPLDKMHNDQCHQILKIVPFHKKCK